MFNYGEGLFAIFAGFSQIFGGTNQSLVEGWGHVFPPTFSVWLIYWEVLPLDGWLLYSHPHTAGTSNTCPCAHCTHNHCLYKSCNVGQRVLIDRECHRCSNCGASKMVTIWKKDSLFSKIEYASFSQRCLPERRCLQIRVALASTTKKTCFKLLTLMQPAWNFSIWVWAAPCWSTETGICELHCHLHMYTLQEQF